MADRMPPPGSSSKPSAVIAIAVPKRNGGNDGDGGRMPPPGTPVRDHGAKVTPDEAAVVREDQHCIDCQMYHPDTGECDKVESTFAPDDGCHMYFTPLDDEDKEPDADEQGGPSDQDTDDQAQSAPGAGA